MASGTLQRQFCSCKITPAMQAQTFFPSSSSYCRTPVALNITTAFQWKPSGGTFKPDH